MNSNTASGSGTGGNGSSGNPYVDYYNRWSDSTPYVTRTSIIGIVVVYILSWFFTLDRILANIPYYTIFYFEVYRLILSPLVGNSILNVIIIMLFYPTMAARMENSVGSTNFIVLLGMISILTNILFVAVCVLLDVTGYPGAILWPCMGFWDIIFGLITIECLALPDLPRQLMFIPVNIPSKYFPLVVYAFFAIFNGPSMDFALSMVVGAAYSKGYLDRLKLSAGYVDNMESGSGFLHSASRQRGWVLAGLAIGHEAWLPTNAATADRSTSEGSSGGANSGFSSFSPWGNRNATSGGPSGGGGSSSGSGNSKEINLFPGSGRTLSSSSGGGVYSALPTAPPMSSPTREEVAQRRLKQLVGDKSDTQTKQEQDIETLTSMGFSSQESMRALSQAGGDIEEAIAILTA